MNYINYTTSDFTHVNIINNLPLIELTPYSQR